MAESPSRTLDVWMEGEGGVRRNYYRGTGDITVVEGVMGVYDGDASSTAMVAEALDLPIVLVVDAKAGMESVAATALGFEQYAERAGRDVDIAGIIAQRAHGGRHERGIRNGLPDELEYFGRIHPSPDLEIPDRHLGLHMGEESSLPVDALDDAAAHIDTDRLIDVAREPPQPPSETPTTRSDACIGVASDAAFSFVYPSTIERFRERGRVETFSPLAGDPLPDCDAIYLPGGYPELHADTLAQSPTVRSIGREAADGLPILGECGGLMTVAESVETADGHTVQMAGVLPANIQMRDRYQALDHVELRATTDTLTATQGEQLRGHEFHYSTATVAPDASYAFRVERGTGIEDERDGLTEFRTLGTYAHIHAESGAFDTFIDST